MREQGQQESCQAFLYFFFKLLFLSLLLSQLLWEELGDGPNSAAAQRVEASDTVKAVG